MRLSNIIRKYMSICFVLLVFSVLFSCNQNPAADCDDCKSCIICCDGDDCTSCEVCLDCTVCPDDSKCSDCECSNCTI